MHASFFLLFYFSYLLLLDFILVLLARLFLFCLFLFTLSSSFPLSPRSLSLQGVWLTAGCWLLAVLLSISDQLWYLTRLILSLLATLFHHPQWKLSQITRALCKYLMRLFPDQASNHRPHLLPLQTPPEPSPHSLPASLFLALKIINSLRTVL